MLANQIKKNFSKEDKELWKYDNLSSFNNIINNDFVSFENYIDNNAVSINTYNDNSIIHFNKELNISKNLFELFNNINLKFEYSGLNLHKFDFNINKDLILNIEILKEDDNAIILNYFNFNISSGCKLELNIISNGSSFEKNIINTTQFKNSHFSIKTRSILKKNNSLDFSVISKLKEENCKLDQDLKAVLFDKSKYSTLGEIVILKSADNADAKHYASTLAMSDDITIYARPFLKIDNGNVKCAHGCPSSYISESDLFYLRSRGLSKKEAQKLFIHSFINNDSDLITNSLED